MADEPIIQMAADPDFAKMPISEQRKALTAHDPAFGQMGDSDVSQFVSAHQAARAPIGTGLLGGANATMQALPKTFSLPWLKSKLIGAGDIATEALPGAGATAGAILGGTGGTLAAPGPGSILGGTGGAAIGGMGGEAAKQLLRRALGFGGPSTSEEASNKIMGEGATQGIIQGLTEGLPFLAGPLKRAAGAQYERALAPTTKINKAITKDITPELIQRGETGTLEGLEKKAGQKISQLNPKLNQAYQSASSMPTSMGSLPATIPGSGKKIIDDLEALKQSYMPQGQIAQPQAVSAIEGVQGIVKQYGDDISPTTLRRLRQIFEEVPAQRGAYAGADLSTNYTLNAQQQAADSIRGILNKNPDIGSLNKEISFWLDVQRVTSQSGLRRTGQEGGLMKILSPLAGVLAGSAGFAHSPGTGVAAGAGTALAGYAMQATRSPLWRTTSAVAKDRFANALARGDVGEVTALLARLGAATAKASQSSPSQQSNTASR